MYNARWPFISGYRSHTTSCLGLDPGISSASSGSHGKQMWKYQNDYQMSLSTCLRLNNMLEMNHSISGKKHNQLITGTKMKLLRYVVAEYWKIGSCSGRSWKWLLPCPVYHPMVGKYHTRFKESMYIYICCRISVSTCSQLGIFVFSFYTLCIPGYSAANDAHRSSTLRLSPAFSSSSAVKKRAFKTMRSWHQLVSVKTRRVVYIHELQYKWKNIYNYIYIL